MAWRDAIARDQTCGRRCRSIDAAALSMLMYTWALTHDRFEAVDRPMRMATGSAIARDTRIQFYFCSMWRSAVTSYRSDQITGSAAAIAAAISGFFDSGVHRRLRAAASMAESFKSPGQDRVVVISVIIVFSDLCKSSSSRGKPHHTCADASSVLKPWSLCPA